MNKVILLGTPYFVSELRNSITNVSSIEVTEYNDETFTDNALYVYFGNSEEDKTSNYSNISLTDLVENSCVVPVLKDLECFRSYIPEELSAINAISIESPSEVGKLKCYILEYFGLLESNRKVFISYKRSDSLAFAHQLHDALIAAHYRPFLDSYSIDYGVDFQEHLRHELSNSAIFIFLNTPNYEMSQFTMEELNICGKLQLGMLEIKAPRSRNYEEAKFSVLYELKEEIDKNTTYADDVIRDILSVLENNRLEIQTFRQKALGDQLKSIYPDVVEDSETNGYASPNGECKYFPVYHIPNSFDMQNIQKYSIRGSLVKGFYNGLYCRKEVRTHIDWLNEISPVQMLDITK